MKLPSYRCRACRYKTASARPPFCDLCWLMIPQPERDQLLRDLGASRAAGRDVPGVAETLLAWAQILRIDRRAWRRLSMCAIPRGNRL